MKSIVKLGAWALVPVLFILSTASQAMADCQARLSTEATAVQGDNIQLQQTAIDQLSKLGWAADDFAALLTRSELYAASDEDGRIYTMVFGPESRRDTGYKIMGVWNKSGQFSAYKIEPSSPEWENAYFRTVARHLNIMPHTLNLQKPVLNCRSMLLAGWVQIKLRLKHHLLTSKVEDLLNESSAPPKEDFKHERGDRRFAIISRGFRAVFRVDGQCPHPLLTVFHLERR